METRERDAVQHSFAYFIIFVQKTRFFGDTARAMEEIKNLIYCICMCPMALQPDVPFLTLCTSNALIILPIFNYAFTARHGLTQLASPNAKNRTIRK